MMPGAISRIGLLALIALALAGCTTPPAESADAPADDGTDCPARETGGAGGTSVGPGVDREACPTPVDAAAPGAG